MVVIILNNALQQLEKTDNKALHYHSCKNFGNNVGEQAWTDI